jgi:hypothetical protein
LFSFFAAKHKINLLELDKLMNQAHANGVFNGSKLVAENAKVIYRKALVMQTKKQNSY